MACKIKVFTAFSGYDSQCLALDSIGADYELVGWSEIDKYAIMAHDALFPQWSDRNYGDISKIDWRNVPDFDLFTYSSPCQDFSQAGMQKGGKKGSGTRSSLLWECERAITEKKPKYLLFENVAALVSNKFIGLFNEWQLTLSRKGYTNFVQVLNAKTHGFPTPLPQNRQRVFMVSILDCLDPFFFPDKVPLDLKLKDILEDSVDEKYYLKDKRIDGLLSSTDKQSIKGNNYGFHPKSGDDEANSITTKNGSRKTDNFVKIVGNLQPENKWQGKVIEKIILPSNTKDGSVTMDVGGICDLSYPSSTTRRGRVQNDGNISPTLTTNTENCLRRIESDYRIRKLTPKECFRLMGVSDINISKIQSSNISDSQQYKLAGNSIVVNCLAAIFKQLLFGNSNKHQQLEIF